MIYMNDLWMNDFFYIYGYSMFFLTMDPIINYYK
jgi:hypothetical protein